MAETEVIRLVTDDGPVSEQARKLLRDHGLEFEERRYELPRDIGVLIPNIETAEGNFQGIFEIRQYVESL